VDFLVSVVDKLVHEKLPNLAVLNRCFAGAPLLDDGEIDLTPVCGRTMSRRLEIDWRTLRGGEVIVVPDARVGKTSRWLFGVGWSSAGINVRIGWESLLDRFHHAIDRHVPAAEV